MPTTPIITLLTDFGLQDEYVGVMKGVILSIHPQASLIDLTHNIEHQNVFQASQILKAAYGYFPDGTIHMSIIDPGVGSSRRIVAGQCQGYGFIAPDNGLLPGVWGDNRPDQLYYVENKRWFLNTVSGTFHGRDIFAPVVAHLSLGMEWSQLGPVAEYEQLERTEENKSRFLGPETIAGEITTVDHFGNLITNISVEQLRLLRGDASWTEVLVQIDDQTVKGISSFYNQCEKGQLVALISSRNTLEIALNQGNAAQYMKVVTGTQVFVKKLTLGTNK